MYSNQLNSKIASFLALQTDHMAKVRDHIPSGPENFKFFKNDEEMNWYEFWDQVAEHGPFGMKFKTDLYTLKFDENKLEWVLAQSEFHDEKHIQIILKNLNTYEIQAKSIRNWIKWNNN